MISLTVFCLLLFILPRFCWKEVDETRTAFIPALLPSLSPFPTKQFHVVQLSEVHIYLFPASKAGEEHQSNRSTFPQTVFADRLL